MLNNELTQEQAIWLIEEYAPKKDGRLDGNTMDKYFVPARSYMTGKSVGRPGCGCHYKAFASMTNSMYSQYYEDIKAVAYPPKKVTRSGRKTSTNKG